MPLSLHKILRNDYFGALQTPIFIEAVKLLDMLHF